MSATELAVLAALESGPKLVAEIVEVSRRRLTPVCHALLTLESNNCVASEKNEAGRLAYRLTNDGTRELGRRRAPRAAASRVGAVLA